MKIYCITNSVNGKRYVGQTIQSIEARWRAHRSSHGRCRALENAIRKYGAEAFSIEGIAIAESQSELDRLEQLWIERLDTVSPKGYNLRGGGGGVGRMHDETKAIMRAIGKRPERLVQMAEMRNSPEVRAKMTEGLKARWRDPKFKKKTGAAISASLNKPAVKAKRSAAMVLAACKPEYKKKLATAMVKAHARPEVKKKHSAGMVAAWNSKTESERIAIGHAISAAKSTPEARARYAATNALPEVKARRSAANSAKPPRTAEQRNAQSVRQLGKKLGPQDRSYLTPEFKARRGAAIRAGKARAKASRAG